MSNEKEKLPTNLDWSLISSGLNFFTVDKTGEGYAWAMPPTLIAGQWHNTKKGDDFEFVAYGFDASNWQNSLQKRPD